MADNNKENRMSIDDFNFVHEDATDDTSMMVNYLVTWLHQAIGNPALQDEVQQQLHAYGILPPFQQERGPERFQGETSKRGLSTKKGVENPYQELKQLLEGKPSYKKKGHAQHERSPSREREESESSDQSMEDVAPRQRRAQRSPTPTKRKRSPHVVSLKEKRRTQKRRRRERGHPLLPPHHPLPLRMKVVGILLKKDKGEDTKGHMLLGRDKVLVFIQQFDAAFGDEGFTESSKLRHVAMHFQSQAIGCKMKSPARGLPRHKIGKGTMYELELQDQTPPTKELVRQEAVHQKWSIEEYPRLSKFFFLAKELHEEYGLSLEGKLLKELLDKDIPNEEWLSVFKCLHKKSTNLFLNHVRDEFVDECRLLYQKEQCNNYRVAHFVELKGPLSVLKRLLVAYGSLVGDHNLYDSEIKVVPVKKQTDSLSCGWRCNLHAKYILHALFDHKEHFMGKNGLKIYSDPFLLRYRDHIISDMLEVSQATTMENAPLFPDMGDIELMLDFGEGGVSEWGHQKKWKSKEAR
ncbi:hypothetical protein L7F22_014402 [Adiantum nelumboides]|nr:hypothetical protein [Adiantum nelumboides]